MPTPGWTGSVLIPSVPPDGSVPISAACTTMAANMKKIFFISCEVVMRASTRDTEETLEGSGCTARLGEADEVRETKYQSRSSNRTNVYDFTAGTQKPSKM